MAVSRSVVSRTYPIAAPSDTITAIASAYGFGSQTAFPQMRAAGQGGAEMVSVRRKIPTRKDGHEYSAQNTRCCGCAAAGRQGLACHGFDQRHRARDRPRAGAGRLGGGAEP